jgi:probable lipoprotein NlpC
MVVEAAKKYIGTPYVYAGMSSRGVDCSGFILLSFNDALGVTGMPRSATGLHSWAEAIPIERVQPGDLLFFRTGSTNAITHVGLYVGDRRFLHAASAGSQTGVIYSSLDEQYYRNTYASAGRALSAASTSAIARLQRNTERRSNNNSSGSSNLFVGAAFAPTWDFYRVSENLIRGYTSQINFGIDFGEWLTFGVELRPEYDGALGVFRIPLTLSWGHRDKVRFFLGPTLSIGDAEFYFKDNYRYYYGGTSWLGTVGITYAPFTLKIANNQFAPYIEGVWQSYFRREDIKPHFASDFTACIRISTGLRWRMPL